MTKCIKIGLEVEAEDAAERLKKIEAKVRSVMAELNELENAQMETGHAYQPKEIDKNIDDAHVEQGEVETGAPASEKNKTGDRTTIYYMDDHRNDVNDAGRRTNSFEQISDPLLSKPFEEMKLKTHGYASK
ncbi:hypothetical protein BGZ51_002365 [Haplosporangium sp. Z 767]|nr:hypothetical protein BGZ50_002827 [Haplosporangium sp. Z 11]KAF9193701.1 hypothetical protein BGZ51_002365 [Haplosporangium sp. Z 767]